MSTGKKRSGFQITSVTSDYDQKGGEGQKESFGGDPGSPVLSPLANGGQHYPSRTPRNSPRNSPPASAIVRPADGDPVLPPATQATKEAKARVAEEVRVALPWNPRVQGASPPVTVDGKASTVHLESGPSLGMTPANSGETLSSQLDSSSSSVPVNSEASSGRQTSSSGPQLPASAPNGHASLVNGTASPPQSKAGSSGGAIPKNEPLSSMMNGSLGSPVATTCPVTASSSRFRVVKLDQGSGEPYKRGRWTCVDFYDKDMDNQSISKILDSMRHAHSLDSHLEVAGLSHKPVTQFYPQPQGKGHGTTYVHSQGTAHLVLHNATLDVTNQHQARSLCGLPQINLERGLGAMLKSPLSAMNSPMSEFRPLFPHPQTSDTAQGTGTTASTSDTRFAGPQAPSVPASEGSARRDSGTREQHAGGHPSGTSGQVPQGFHTVPVVVVVEEAGANHLKPKSVLQQIQAEEKRKGPAQDSRSRSPSPARTSYLDGSSSRLLSDPFSVHSARLTLARSMFSMESDDESGSSSSMVAIDNKIEQAMDLVKTHLMFAVREEVDVLREQIKDLVDRNTLLEQENSVLKSLASPEQLSEMQAKMHSLRLGMAPPANGTSA